MPVLPLLQSVVALAIVAGAVVAVTARLPRLAVLGLLVALAGATFVAEPLPDVPSLLVRLVGAVLGAFVLWAAVRDAGPGAARGTQLGWLGTAAVAVAAFAAGAIASAPLVGDTATASSGFPTLPPAVAAAGAATSLAVIAAGPVLVARDALRLSAGLLLIVVAGDLLRAGLGGTGVVMTSTAELRLESLAVAIVQAAIGGAGAWLCTRTLDAHQGLELGDRAATPAAHGTPSRQGTARHAGATSRRGIDDGRGVRP